MDYTTYFEELSNLFPKIEAADSQGQQLSLEQAVTEITDLICSFRTGDNKVILIGNGGSAAIASHLAVDFLKNNNIAALTFNDASSLTCLANDLGYEYVFAKPIQMLAQEDDILFAISSSGQSQNILNATLKAKGKGCFIATLSGFEPTNPLRKMGEINFYVPSFSYGYVEIIHLAICHLISDIIKDHG